MAVKMKWYLVNVQENCECVAKKAIEEKIRAAKMEEFFGAIVIPADNPEGHTSNEETEGALFFPGFLFVHMILNEQTMNLVRSSPQVTDFTVTNRRNAA